MSYDSNIPSGVPQQQAQVKVESMKTKLIPLTRGQFAIVDESDFEFLNKWKWNAKNHRKTWYAQRSVYDSSIRKSAGNLQMHRFIYELHNGQIGENLFIDHKDGNGLNNQLSNLRACTHSENCRNSSIVGSKWGYKGVSRVKYPTANEKFRARIMLNKKQIHVGYFSTPVEAAKAYNEAAIKYHGEFAALNIIPNELKQSA